MKTILIIEDDRKVGEYLQSLFEDEFRTLTAVTGEEGLDMLSREEVALVILDYSLPGMNGLEALRRIRSARNVPVIMMSGYADKDVVVRSWRDKANCYFDKPFRPAEIREKVRELLPGESPFAILGLDPLKLSPLVRQALRLVFSNFDVDETSCAMSIRNIAKAVNVSSKYLSSAFKRECRLGIHQCVNILRIERAKRLLESGKSIKEVAFGLGYSHPNNFSRLYKKLTGEAPSSVKKAL